MSPAEESNTSRKPAWITAAAVVCIAAVMVTYARTFAFAWDEGYHLVAAWLIAHGKQPYIDFVFPQTPLNAYWNAILLRVFGMSWRVPDPPWASSVAISLRLFLTGLRFIIIPLHTVIQVRQ